MVFVLSFSWENFLVIYGLSICVLDWGVLEDGMTVDLLFCALGKYLADVTPEPKDADSALGLETETPYTSFRYSSTVNFLLSSTEVEMILSQLISSYGLWKALTISWLRISSIFMRLFGLKTMIRSKKSAKDGEKSLRKFVALAFVDILISFIMDLDT